MREINRIYGFVLLLAGLSLVTFGVSSSLSVFDKIHQMFSEGLSHPTALQALGGSAIATLGLVVMLFAIRGLNA